MQLRDIKTVESKLTWTKFYKIFHLGKLIILQTFRLSKTLFF